VCEGDFESSSCPSPMFACFFFFFLIIYVSGILLLNALNSPLLLLWTLPLFFLLLMTDIVQLNFLDSVSTFFSAAKFQLPPLPRSNIRVCFYHMFNNRQRFYLFIIRIFYSLTFEKPGVSKKGRQRYFSLVVLVCRCNC